MPCITQSERETLDPAIDRVVEVLGRTLTPGKLNYVFSRIIWKIFEENKNYTSGNTLLGVLSAVALEFYRRRLAPLEDFKCSINGDIEL